jgi:molybdate transport system permease protein
VNGYLTTSFISPILISLKIAGMATCLALVCGGGLAWLLSGRHGFRASVLETAISLPLVFPPTVVGFYLLNILGRTGLLGGIIYQTLKINIIFTPAAAVLAAAIAALPLMFKPLKNFFEYIDPDIIGAARLDGASEFAVLREIRLPLASKGILTGVGMSFLRALGEFGATLMVAGNIPGKTQTLSLAIWGFVMSGEPAKAHILALLLTGICVITVISLRLIDRKFNNWDWQTPAN